MAGWTVRGVRLVCYVAILHTSFAYGSALREGTILAWANFTESIAWLLIALATEAAVHFRHVTYGGISPARAALRLKAPLYFAILAIAAYWGSKGHFLYLWDELVWVLGFRAIDWNLGERPGPGRTIRASPSAA
jgi:hypothetical protein